MQSFEATPATAEAPRPAALRFKAMGCPCELRVYGRPDQAADAALRAAQAEVLRLERKYTRYRDDSTTAAINRSAGNPGGFAVDFETAGLLDYAQSAWEASDGLFDPTSGVLRRAWDFRSGRLPSRAEVNAILDQVGWQRVEWQRPRLRLPTEGMQLDFGGFVKEYAADRVAQQLRDAGFTSGLVDLGGDLAIVGPHPDGTPWRVGVRDPFGSRAAASAAALHRGGMATSGDYERGMVVDGKRYGHILDPRTGWPVESWISVTVAAEQCLVAGTASTIAMLRGPAGIDWLEGLGLPWVAIDDAGNAHGPLASDLVRAA